MVKKNRVFTTRCSCSKDIPLPKWIVDAFKASYKGIKDIYERENAVKYEEKNDDAH